MAATVVVGVVVALAHRSATSRDAAAERPAVPPERFLAAQRAVRWPALAMLVVAFLNCVPIIILLADDYTAFADLPMFSRLVMSMLSAVISTVTIFAAFSMRELRFRTLAMVASILLLVPCHYAFLPGIVIGIWSLSVLARADVRDAFLVHRGRLPLATAGKADVAWTPSGGMPILLAALFAVIPCVLATYFIAYRLSQANRPPTAIYAIDPNIYTRTPPKPADLDAIRWGVGGPRLGPRIRYLGLTEAQIAELDRALSDTYKQYEAEEQKHIARKQNELGHSVITIAPFPKELGELEDRFWTAADRIVTDNDKQGMLRSTLVFPGNIFRYGQSQTTLEMWKSGSWFYLHDGYNQSRWGSELPRQYQGLWQQPTDETKTDSKSH
jgi:hypothetical protein